MADWRKDPKMRYVVFGVVIMTAIGFSFGILLSAQQVVDVPQNGNGEEPELPESDYQTEPFDLSTTDQSFLAQTNDVVFVNAYVPEDDEETQQVVEDLLDTFAGRIYIAESTSATGIVASNYGLIDEELPTLIVVGGQGQTAQDMVERVDAPVTQDMAEQAVCDVMIDTTEYSDICL